MEVMVLDFSHFLVYFLLAVVALQLLRNFVLPLVGRRPALATAGVPAAEPWRAPPSVPVNDEVVGRVSSLLVYPIKSCRGVPVLSADVGPRGFVMDRQLCLVDEGGSFVTLRQVSKLALVDVSWQPGDKQLVLNCDDAAMAKTVGVLLVDLQKGAHEMQEIPVRIWDDNVICSLVGREADGWFTAVTGVPLRLVRIGQSFDRVIPPNVRADPAGIDTSLADGFPYLITTLSSLQLVSSAAHEHMSMARFRPNIVVDDRSTAAAEGVPKFHEDFWAQLAIGATQFWGVKPCSRCKIPRLDPNTGAEHPAQHPTAALQSLGHFYKSEAYFGMNLCHRKGAEGAIVSVGDAVVLQRRFTRRSVSADVK